MPLYRRVICGILGLVCFLIGVVGIFIPVIPQLIPFLLSFLFFKLSRPPVINWLMKSKLAVRLRLEMRELTRWIDTRWPKIRGRKRIADFLRWLRPK